MRASLRLTETRPCLFLLSQATLLAAAVVVPQPQPLPPPPSFAAEVSSTPTLCPSFFPLTSFFSLSFLQLTALQLPQDQASALERTLQKDIEQLHLRALELQQRRIRDIAEIQAAVRDTERLGNRWLVEMTQGRLKDLIEGNVAW